VPAQSGRYGVAASPGPPASVISAPSRLPKASRRSTWSFTVPGTAPARSSGTGNVAHWMSDPRWHGLKSTAACDAATGHAAAAAARIPAKRRMY
jgi:hypothetical protein